MTAILKTLPTRFARGEIERFFGLAGKPCWTTYFFTLGRGRPKRCDPTEIYFTHKGIIVGHFTIADIVKNAGQLPLLRTMDGDPSAWQIPPDAWVAICAPPFHRLKEKLYHEGFRGWRYFDIAEYRGLISSKVRL